MVMGASLSHSMHGGVSVAALAASLDSGAVLYRKEALENIVYNLQYSL